MRRILVISYHFPPDGAVGGLRWAGLSKYLARMGWEVHVVTASAGSQQVTPGVHRHVRRRRRTLNDVYKDVVSRLRRASNADRRLALEHPNVPRLDSTPEPVSAVRRILRSSMDLPDVGRGWVERGTAGARSLLRDREFDVVISSGPPHSAHLAGMFATLDSPVPFWIDMRDPWSVIHDMNSPDDWIVRAERFLMRGMERLVFPRAAKVIVNTREFASALRVGEPNLDVTYFPNGIDLEELPPRDLSTVEQGSIAYIGTLYAGRNLSSVCAAMRALLTDRPEAGATLRLNVAGPMRSTYGLQLQDDVAALGLASVVNIHGLLSHAKALELLGRSHLALVLAQNQPLCVPAKLYESVGLGVPTLVLAEDTSAAACEARRIGAMTLDGRDVEGVRALLEEMLAGSIPTHIAARTSISYEDLAIQMDGLLQHAVGGRHADATREPVTSAIHNERRPSPLRDEA